MQTAPSNPHGARRAHDAAHAAFVDGVAHARARRHAPALDAFRKATRLAPRDSLYWLNRSVAERALGRSDAAIASARRAFELDTGSVLACRHLAQLLMQALRNAEARTVLDRLAPDAPRDAEYWRTLGYAQMALQDYRIASQTWLELLCLQPRDVEAHYRLGFSFAKIGGYAEGAECFRTVLALQPRHLGAALFALHYAKWACQWSRLDGDIEALRIALEPALHGDEVCDFSPFTLLTAVDDPVLQKALAVGCASGRFAAGAGPWPAAGGAEPHAPAHRCVAGGLIRIGFVSSDFHRHATSLLIVQTLEQIDRRRFEVVLYSHGPDDGSDLRARVVAAADRFVDARELSDELLAQRIRDDGIAVLVDLKGHTFDNRLSLFALRPAPVQAAWLGYPGTTGTGFIDYIVGDPLVTPLEHAAHYSECIAQVPICYQSTDSLRPHPQPATDRAAYGLPQDAFVFASFNQSYKITEPVFDRWCRMLHRIPDSVLWLLIPEAAVQASLVAEAAARGIDRRRLVFAPFVDPTAHLARLPLADLFLDSFPCGAHTTCTDALWMGLPVLTIVGESFPSRVAASLLHACGMPEMVTDGLDAYEERAVALATDARPELLAQRDRLIAERLRLPLFDNEQFTRGLEGLFERMVERWLAGEAPAALPARAHPAPAAAACTGRP